MLLIVFFGILGSSTAEAKRNKRIEKLFREKRETIARMESTGYTCGIASYYAEYHHGRPMKNREKPFTL